MADFTLEQNRADSQQLFEMFWTIRSCPHPVIGRLHGHVMGGAVGLAALCDVTAAVEGTQFCFSEARLGIVPAVISPFVLERMQIAPARRYMVTAEVFGAREAESAGLVQFVGKDETAVDEFIEGMVKSLLGNGPEAVRATKRLIAAMLEVTDWDKRRELTTQLIAERRVSAEGQEGLRGFLEKRPPKWKSVE
jgi:methylglutaconyl-CoA hydratase